MRRRAAGVDGQRMIELERPEWQIVPMASEVTHGAAAKIPPAIPLRARKIDLVKRTLRRGAEPQVPVQITGRRLGLLGPFGHTDNVTMPLGVLWTLPTP